MVTFVSIDKSNPRAGSAEGRAELIYKNKSRRFPKGHGGLKRPPYDAEVYFYVVQAVNTWAVTSPARTMPRLIFMLCKQKRPTGVSPLTAVPRYDTIIKRRNKQ